ncbi:MAG: galactose oxidase-like domain-containing protein, partial [bacterium]
REYHSVALLMPDGRVWHAGTSPEPDARIQERRIDLYEPWYYSRTRPKLNGWTGDGDPLYGQAPLMHLRDTRMPFVVDHYRPIDKFVLIRAGSATHAFNSDQRYIELESRLVETTQRSNPDGFMFKFEVVGPPSSTIAPPGMYLLFALDDVGVPSEGRFIRLDRRFVAELQVEAEDFTSKTPFGIGVPVPGDGTVRLNARTVPFALFPQLEYGGIDFGPQSGRVKTFSVFGRGIGDPLRGIGSGAIVVHLDKPDGPVIARVALGNAPSSVEHLVDVTPVSGVHNVHITYVVSLLPLLRDPTTASARVDWFKFKP